MNEFRNATIKVVIGELLGYRKTHKGEGFVLTDESCVDHYFYFTSDRRFVKYDGWSARPEDVESKESE